jgi:thiamine biosynthesis protein ThiC
MFETPFYVLRDGSYLEQAVSLLAQRAAGWYSTAMLLTPKEHLSLPV